MVFLIALVVRANLPLIVALQWISNPISMGPIYFADYQIGMVFLNLLGINYERNKLLNSEYNWSEFSLADLKTLLDTFPPMLVGGSIIGISLGVISVFLYKLVSKTYKKNDDPKFS